MKRAVVAPLLSLFMPGMGQLVNRQAVKGGLMVAVVSLLFIAALGLTFHQFSQAVVALGEVPPGVDKWAALNVQLVKQGILWMLVLLGLYVAILVWSVADAWRRGKALDSEEKGSR